VLLPVPPLLPELRPPELLLPELLLPELPVGPLLLPLPELPLDPVVVPLQLTELTRTFVADEKFVASVE
jgi:hypothetical protein